MFKINRLKVEIETVNGTYGLDECFSKGLNFISSQDNTKGKSSILEAIYYCLGFEQIIGGTNGIGSKVLTSVFKSSIEDKNKTWSVLESGAYLEISNGISVVTIYRNMVSDSKDNKLVTVYYSDLNSISNNHSIQSEDYYVNMPNSATSDRGFHTFLEKFLHIELPIVNATDGNDRKLYLQMIFSASFIEQKHGWGDLLSGMPFFGIKESKKRTIEYLLNLGVFETEKEKSKLKDLKTKIDSNWKSIIDTISLESAIRDCYILNIPVHPRILKDFEVNNISIYTNKGIRIDKKIIDLEKELNELSELKPKVIDNFEELHNELELTEKEIYELDLKVKNITESLSFEEESVNKLVKSIDILNKDIQNNKDVARLQKLGSDNGFDIETECCPVCKQKIQDNILVDTSNNIFMNIDQNIQHLIEQKKLLEFSLNGHIHSKKSLLNQKSQIESNIITLTKLAQTIRSDLYESVDTSNSETIILKKINLQQRIESLTELTQLYDKFRSDILELSDLWTNYLDKKNSLPKENYSNSDYKKINLLKTKFIDNLKEYNYSSLSDFNTIDISKDTLLPTIDGFDMKFDSSASDSIRLIWAYTLALLQVSIEMNGNHPKIIVFDEPAQQSIVPEDMNKFINSLVKLGKESQIILAITLNSDELNNIVNKLDENSYYNISIENKAFSLL